MISAAASAMPTTARLKTALPSCWAKCNRASTVARVAGRSEPPAGWLSESTPEPSTYWTVSRTPVPSAVGSSRTAPAPSPKMTHVARSV